MYQKITIIGNVGRDPEARYAPNGTAVTGFSVATNRKYKGADGQKMSETTWWKVSTFSKLAETCAEYVKKGSLVLVEGRMNPDPQTGGPRLFEKRDGGHGASYELIADTVRFLGGGQDNSGSSQESSAKQDEESNEF